MPVRTTKNESDGEGERQRNKQTDRLADCWAGVGGRTDVEIDRQMNRDGQTKTQTNSIILIDR